MEENEEIDFDQLADEILLSATKQGVADHKEFVGDAGTLDHRLLQGRRVETEKGEKTPLQQLFKQWSDESYAKIQEAAQEAASEPS